ncbi:GAF domain-containing protein [Pontibacter liquoris]|uniref:GAF domain-containing protein n=1 Tax=Pontibacter liquoris TaxID=2905677 RepID=UPI001FA7162D|nr:GAF domain-containing protein [Pontibacter liquoris]
MENNAAAVPVNTGKNYDSEFCGSIPLNLVNQIQPHGLLLVLDKQLRLVQVSENATDYFAVPLEELLDQPLAAFVLARQFQEMEAKIESKSRYDKIPMSLTLAVGGKEFACTALIHTKEEYVLLELEEDTKPSAEKSFTGLYQQIKYITSLLKQADTLADVGQIAADEIKKITGLDRVLVYRFDPQWNGSVIAQAKEADMDDYMGLRFPASDVPRQARELYFKNPFRLIPTRVYTPVRLLPIVNPLTQRFTDLADCNLRSVAGVHLEYLANLGVMASMSLPLIIDDKLWGLISCHHKAPFYPSYELRSALELLTGIVSAQVASKERERGILYQARLKGMHAQLLERLYSGTDLADGLLNGATNVAELLGLTGVAISYDGELQTSGQVPDRQSIKELTFWLRHNQGSEVFATDNLAKHYRQSLVYKDIASGLISLPINPDQGEYLLGFRAEVLQTVSWGGNPDKAIQIEPDGKTYHPRNSFASYQEVVKNTSLPWYAEEMDAAKALRNAVLEKILRDRY